MSDCDITPSGFCALRVELVQTAAVAVAMVECLDRNEPAPSPEREQP